MIETLIKPENDIFPNRKRTTRTVRDFLVKNGLLTERHELIDGVIILKMPMKPPHRIALMRLQKWLILLFGFDFVQSEKPILLPGPTGETTEPEPDIAITREPSDDYAENNPGPQDILLVAEVFDTTLRSDLETKALLYARVGIPEYLVLDVVARQIHRHRQPTHDGYSEIIILTENLNLSLLNRSETIQVGDLFPALPVASASRSLDSGV